ncbi:sulfotransferase domain-containing protein [Stackebrandtia nassauensis]|uniref:Sulfotransferase n=1 Tax=Stackebrandtia nassauensis (strain DSM 44728 / CIP 108903 / NRRL B-16338 / NBRC 102104 / LLR-40K-21) TaxID=446470 RepID=D3Q2P6_STANL|nr:sulfotransferase domain-containing protein [Stackebrandtia nassauensis]ADD45797.1 sulfotransferase [Stackebrandtia nassauensis DSM 44728]
MSPTFHRYTAYDEDSARWTGFRFRDGDIVISTRSKSGTTWTQMICALLIFGTPEPPRPLPELSPWLDHLVEPREAVIAALEAQTHRRFIKTHTPLDGVPVDPRAHYLVVFRHPLDMAVSLYHHGNNLDRDRVRELIGLPEPAEPEPPRPPLRDWLLEWIDRDVDPREATDSLPGAMHHLRDAWERRDQPNITLLHYADLKSDLDGQMRGLAERLGFEVDERTWPRLVEAATFEQMKSNNKKLAPDRSGVFKDAAAFFRQGRSGTGREVLTDAELARYHDRVADLAPSEALEWLHRP